MMNRFFAGLRAIFVRKTPATCMKADAVLATARAYLEARGGQLQEPVYVSFSEEGQPKRLVWLVRDNADQRGGNAYLRIDDKTGAVVEYSVPGSEPVA